MGEQQYQNSGSPVTEFSHCLVSNIEQYRVRIGHICEGQFPTLDLMEETIHDPPLSEEIVDDD